VTEFEHAKALAWVLGSEPPAFSIGYEKPTSPHDSGFTVLFDDAPDPDDLPVVDPAQVSKGELPPGITFVCLHCLIDDHPEIGRGLDIAREYGVADLDENGEWVVGDLSRLSSD
jgi:hypothetical protein